MAALIAPEIVKPAQGADRRIAIWGALEARLQTVDTLVVGGLNEGSWPRRAEADRFMSRMMKSGLDLEPPERRIGQAAHDFMMAMGTKRMILTRSARVGRRAGRTARAGCSGCRPSPARRQPRQCAGRGRQLLAWAASSMPARR